MRNQMTVMVAISLLTASSVALAKAEAPEAKPGAEKAAAQAPMTPPKPPAENDMFKKSSGTWSCEGTAKGPEGTEMKYKSSWAIKPIFGGQWYSIVYKRGKMGPLPAFEGNANIGYNVAEKKYWMVGVDSMGGWINLTSTDNSVYTGESSPMGKKTPAKFTFVPGKDKKGQDSDKLFDVTLEFNGVAVSHELCKK
jgi:hypothetical protein